MASTPRTPAGSAATRGGEHVEVELTWSPPPGALVPDLTALPQVAEMGPAVIHDLHATYFDTADLRLTRAGVTLRRRTGGPDEGWHLKVPVKRGRDEVRHALGRSTTTPPTVLARAVLGFTRGAPLAPVATLATVRTAYDLLDDTGSVLAELADDRVTATVASTIAGSGAAPGAMGEPDGSLDTVEWREWEIELVAGRPQLLRAAGRLMAEHDVPPATEQRKIRRALGERVPPDPVLGRPRAGKPASRAVHTYLAEQVRELVLQDARIRRTGSSDGVHRWRIATRRLRSALRTHRPLLDREITESVRAELGWAARELSGLRDGHVAHDRLRRLLDEESRIHVVGPVRRRLAATYRLRGRDHLREVSAVLASPRYLALLGALDRLVEEPPFTERAGRRADRELSRLVTRQWQRVLEQHDVLTASPDVTGDAAATDHHDLRKATKRLRYAAEVAQAVRGTDARAVAQAARRLTSVLGELQDTVVTRADLLEMSRGAGAAGENAFTYGRLHAREEARARELEAEVDAAWRALVKQLKRW